MRKVALICLFSFGLLLPSVKSQNIESQYRKIRTTQAGRLVADFSGAFYLIEGSTLSKFNADGTLETTYTNFQMGEITSVDVSNPLKIMLFYRESGALLFLDRHLAPIMEPLSLFDHHLYTISLAAFSANDLIWLYDERANDLIAVDFYLQEKYRTSIELSALAPTDMHSVSEKTLFMHDPKQGILVFDAFGTYLKSLRLLAVQPIQLQGSHIIYLEANRLMSYNYKTLQSQTLATLPEGTTQAICAAQKVLLITSDGTLYMQGE